MPITEITWSAEESAGGNASDNPLMISAAESGAGVMLASLSSGTASAAIENDFTLDAQLFGAGISLGYQKDADPNGDLTPKFLDGQEILEISVDQTVDNESLTIDIDGDLAQDFFTSFVINGVTFNSNEAEFSPGETSIWTWPTPGSPPITIAGIYPVTFTS